MPEMSQKTWLIVVASLVLVVGYLGYQLSARNTTIGAIIDESLALAGIKTRADALAILRQAGGNSGLDDDEAMSVALQEVADHRAGR